MQTDFLIVGGGVVGLTSAQILLQAGYRVTLGRARRSWPGSILGRRRHPFAVMPLGL